MCPHAVCTTQTLRDGAQLEEGSAQLFERFGVTPIWERVHHVTALLSCA